MKTYSELLEHLNATQKNKLGILYNDKPRIAANQLSDHIIGHDDYIRIPLTSNVKEEVSNHLEKHGYKLENYASGTALDKHGRRTTIGKVLTNPKTEAHPDLVKAYTNSSRVTGYNNDTHEIVFSRKPEHVAECSTNKGWKSCASLGTSGAPTRYGGGVAAKQIPNHISIGTHVAYLVKKGETNMNKAEARILLHPYHSYDQLNGQTEANPTHTVIMPEEKVYSKTGGKHYDFEKSVESFSRQNFPMKPGEMYKKDSKAYDDDRKYYRMNVEPESFRKIATSGSAHNTTISNALEEIHLPHQTITSLLNHDTKKLTDNQHYTYNSTIKNIARTQKLTDSHVEKLAQRGYVEHLAQNENLAAKHINMIINTPKQSWENDEDISERKLHMMRHTKINSDMANKIIESTPVEHITNYALKKNSAIIHHSANIHKLSNESVYKLASIHPKFVGSLIKNPHLRSEHIQSLLKHNNSDNYPLSENTTHQNHVNLILEHGDKLNAEHLEQIASHAIDHPVSLHDSRLYNKFSHHDVLHAVAGHPNVSSNTLSKINDYLNN